MIQRIRRQQSPAQVIAWAFIPAAILLGAVAVLNFAIMGRVTGDLVAARNDDLAHLLTEQIAIHLDDIGQPLRSLAASDAIRDMEPPAQHAALDEARDQLWNMDAGVVVLDADQRVVAADARRLELIGADWSAQAIDFPAAVFPAVTASDVLPLGSRAADAVALIVPIREGAQDTRGAVVGLVSVSRDHARSTGFYQGLKQFLFRASETIYLTDSAGQVIYHPDTWQIGSTRTLTTGRSRGPDGVERFISTAPVPGTGWQLVIEEEWSTLIAASLPYRWLLLALLALALLLSAAVVWIALRNVQLYARAEAEAAAAERSRLARDLHDAVSQTLFAVHMIAGSLPRLWERRPDEARRQLDQLQTLTRGAQSEMRMLLLELRPEALEATALPDLLEHLIRGTASRTQATIDRDIDAECKLPFDVKIALYRIAQEALNNIAKHADAQHISVRLRCADRLTLSVQDDGAGFDPARVAPDRLGQRTMHERAQSIGARLTVESAPGQGTTIDVEWKGH